MPAASHMRNAAFLSPLDLSWRPHESEPESHLLLNNELTTVLFFEKRVNNSSFFLRKELTTVHD
jgi:hypothetical protein